MISFRSDGKVAPADGGSPLPIPGRIDGIAGLGDPFDDLDPLQEQVLPEAGEIDIDEPDLRDLQAPAIKDVMIRDPK